MRWGFVLILTKSTTAHIVKKTVS